MKKQSDTTRIKVLKDRIVVLKKTITLCEEKIKNEDDYNKLKKKFTK
tara:strand:- start:641 stop:781 length:141 start_codon:yes stop_codon:yes gene_type:complete